MAENKLFAKFQKDAAKPVEAVTSTALHTGPAPEPTTLIHTGPAAVAVPLLNAVSTYNPLAVIQGGDSSATDDVLAALITQDSARQGIMGDFPLVILLGGNSGGMLTAHDEVDEDLAMQLPMGKKTFTAVFLGYRLKCLAWNTGETPDGNKEKPLFAGEINCSDAANVGLLSAAAKNYQFTKKIFKTKFDGLGHIRMGVEFLLFKVGATGQPIFYVLRLPSHYTSSTRALAALQKACPNGKIAAFPATFEPYTTDEPGATAWKCHSVRIAAAIDEKGKAVWEAFQEARPGLIADEEFNATLAKWNATTLTEEGVAALKTIAGMR